MHDGIVWRCGWHLSLCTSPCCLYDSLDCSGPSLVLLCNGESTQERCEYHARFELVVPKVIVEETEELFLHEVDFCDIKHASVFRPMLIPRSGVVEVLGSNYERRQKDSVTGTRQPYGTIYIISEYENSQHTFSHGGDFGP